MEPKKPELEVDAVAEHGKSSTAREKLWIYITPLEKSSEFSRFYIGNRIVSLRYAKSVIQPDVHNSSSFSVSPSLENGNSGDFRAIDFSASGISAGSMIEMCIQVTGLSKGDKFHIFSSNYPYGFKKITIKKYDPDGQLQSIHDKDDLSDSYSVWLDWPWVESES